MSVALQYRSGRAPRLSSLQVEEFFERGWTVVPGLFGIHEIAALRSAFQRLERTAYALGKSRLHRGSQFVLGRRPARGAGVAIERVVWCGAAEPILSSYGRDPRLVALAGQLLGSSMMSQLINQAHFKLPGDGVEFPWHQDSTHRRYGTKEWLDVNGRGSYVQTVLAIDDVRPDNGPMEFIPGSCQLGHLGLPRDGSPPAGFAMPTTTETVVMKAGSLLLFGPYTIHRSSPNTSDTPRRTFINGYASPGANSRTYPGRGAGRILSVPRD